MPIISIDQVYIPGSLNISDLSRFLSTSFTETSKMASSRRELLPRVCWVLFLALALALFLGPVWSEPQVPCYFIFGDSLVDNGNNNDMASLARANYPPYGIDFPGGASGRFTNGLTTVDVIGKFLLPTNKKNFLGFKINL